MTVIFPKKGCTTSTIGYGLVMIGAINWGLVGIGQFVHMNLNLVNLLLGSWPTLEAIVYILVGVSAVMLCIGCKCKTCSACRVENSGGMSSQS